MATNDYQWVPMTTFWLYSDYFLLHSGFILTTFWLHSDCILTTFWVHSNYILTAFWLHSGYISATFWLHSYYILPTSLLHFDYTLSTFWLHSDHILTFFAENICGTYRTTTVQLRWHFLLIYKQNLMTYISDMKIIYWMIWTCLINAVTNICQFWYCTALFRPEVKKGHNIATNIVVSGVLVRLLEKDAIAGCDGCDQYIVFAASILNILTS